MEFSYCDVRYSTRKFEDVEAGCAGLELFASSEILQGRIGKITFWDAAGQFFLEMSGGEVPLEVLEWFVAETKKAIPTE
jgi:hypothetical protein